MPATLVSVATGASSGCNEHRPAALTPTITWWQSEFVFLRLENDYRYDSVLGHQNLALLQVVWALGPHKHETY